jgi:beta-lactamase class C
MARMNAILSLLLAVVSAATIRTTCDAAVHRLMNKDAIPGMSVGLLVDGKPHVFNYGRASIKPETPVTNDTLFELGSVSKTFTATLASLAQVEGRLALSEPVSKDFPALAGSPYGDISLINLGTHTPGGLPLQVPDDVTNTDELVQYLRDWRPKYAPGTYRTYSNISIGTLGLVTAKAFDANFATLVEQKLFLPLGMRESYIDVPSSAMARYAEGYRKGSPVRMTPGVLWAQAYGVRTTASDLLRFVAANMQLLALDPTLQKAITTTHTGYFKTTTFTQDLIWEQYAYPVTQQELLAGNGYTMILDPHPVTAMTPPEKPRADVWINKTGTTNGFAAYVAFIPKRHCGIVLLANENYPIPDRVTTAYAILSSLCE